MGDIPENKETENIKKTSLEGEAEEVQEELAALQEQQSSEIPKDAFDGKGGSLPLTALKDSKEALKVRNDSFITTDEERSDLDFNKRAVSLHGESGYGSWFDVTGDREEAQRLAAQSQITAQKFLYKDTVGNQVSGSEDSTEEEDEKIEYSAAGMDESGKNSSLMQKPYGSLVSSGKSGSFKGDEQELKIGRKSSNKLQQLKQFYKERRKRRKRKKRRKIVLILAALLLCIVLVLSVIQGLLLLILTGAAGGWSSLEVGSRIRHTDKDDCVEGCKCLESYKSGSASDWVAGLQPGDTIEEIIWNTLVAANIEGISDNPSVIAGIIGNIVAESGMCPFTEEAPPKSWGLGLVQWTNPDGGTTGRRKNLEDFMYGVKGIDRKSFEDEIHTSYLTKCNHPEDLYNQVFVAQMEFILYELLTVEKDFLDNLDLVTKKIDVQGASSYAELFCVTYERPGDTQTPALVSDPIVLNYAITKKKRASGMYNGLVHRRDAAVEIFKKFGMSGGTTTATTTTSSAISTGITFIGDTIGVTVEGTLRSALGTLSYIDSEDARTVVEGKDLLESIQNTANLKDTVVLELGTYIPSADDTTTLDSMLSVLIDKTVVLVTPYMASTHTDYEVSGSIVESTAEWIRNVPSVYSNVKIADWALLAKSNESLLSDGLNLTVSAYESYVNLILDVLDIKASAGSTMAKRIVCNCPSECACWEVHGSNVISGEGSEDYAENYALGILPAISADPPDLAVFDALTTREKIVYAAKWYHENGKDVYFYSQNSKVRTLPEDILVSPWQIIDGKAFDCSGFASSMYKLAGLDIELDTDSMNSDDKLTKISWKTAKPGDLLLTNSKGHVIIILSVDVANKKMEIVESGGAGRAYIDKTIKSLGNNFPTLKLRWVDIKPVMVNGVEHKTDITLDNDTSRVYSVRVHKGAD